MSFSERMRGLVGQGVEVSKKVAGKAGVKAQDLGEKGFKASKDFMSKAGAKAQDLGEKGFKASKDFMSKAGAKAQDLGERSILMLEIKQLEGQAKKLMAQLGLAVYESFAVKEAKSITPTTASIKALLAEISSVQEALEKRETELQNRKKPK